jgi:hypothetical protein
MLGVPSFLHPFVGKNILKKDIFWAVFWLILGHILSFLVDRNFYLDPLKTVLYVVLLSDVILGAYFNTTTSVINYYNQHPEHVIRFPLLHIYPFVMIWLFSIPFSLALSTYIVTTFVTYRILTLTNHKALFGWLIIIVVAFIFGLVEQGHSLSYILFTFISVVKLVISFGSNHMLSCPVNLKRR